MLAREGRTRRRMLAMALLGVVNQEPPEQGKASHVLLPSRPGDPYYVFLLLWPPKDVSYDEFREVRRELLEAYCMVLKTIFPDAEDIVGIATEDRTAGSRSEDVLYLDARVWNEELQSEALELQQRLNILRETTKTFRERVLAYPEVQSQTGDGRYRTTRNMKGRDRNGPCPCGSGKKFKKCCGGTSARP